MGVNKKAIKAMFPSGKWKILRGDKVVITAGKDKGQTGIVSKVIRDVKIPRVIVEGRNLVRECHICAQAICCDRTSDHPALPADARMALQNKTAPTKCLGVHLEQKGDQADSR